MFVGRAGIFVTVLVGTAFVATGAWPLIVDSALARTEPSRRPSATIAWNVCEYGVIAAATVSSGWILAAAGSPQVLFVLAARPAGRRGLVRVGRPALAGARAGGVIGGR